MYMLLAGFLCVSGTAFSQPPPPEILQAEILELKNVIRFLREENTKLENRNAQLVNDVLNLGNRIRSLEGELSGLRPEAPAETGEEAAEPEVRKKTDLHPILSVNVSWHYLIVQVGSQSGIQVGESGSVLRDGSIIASCTVTDTKPNQAIVQLDLQSLSEPGIYPRKDDKVRFP